MKAELYKTLFEILIKRISVPDAYTKILSLMGEKEIGVSSTSNTEHGGLHGVSESHASGAKTTEEVGGNGSLEKITDTENKQKNYGMSRLWN